MKHVSDDIYSSIITTNYLTGIMLQINHILEIDVVNEGTSNKKKIQRK
jgi:hypothetical protein